jgi:MSHA biogenesis protein MshJ
MSYFLWLNQWLDQRNNWQKIVFWLTLFCGTYLFWHLAVTRAITLNIKMLDNEITTSQSSLDAIRLKMASVILAVTQHSYNINLTQQHSLQKQAATSKKQLTKLLPSVLSMQDYAKLMKDIFSVRKEVVTLSVKNLPATPWVPDGMDINTLPAGMNNIYRYNLQIEFNGQYFSTFDYLTYLEKFPWRIYWDSLDYEVKQYPNATVTATFHVLGYKN